MTAIKTLIIDDEPAQQELMSRLLLALDEIEVVGIGANMDQGLRLIEELEPDLIFLDVDLGEHSGFDLLQRIESREFEVIFCTSHSEFAIHAFRVAAIDYLLKPIDKDILKVAVEKFKSRRTNNGQQNQALINLLHNLQLPLQEQSLALPTSSGLIFISPHELVHIEANNSLTIFYTTDNQQIVVSRSMKECEEMLGLPRFCRIHQSHLVNLAHVKKYIKGDGGQVVMSNGQTLEVSRRKKDEFLAALKRI